MIIGNNYDLGSWKCGKVRAFTHISGRPEESVSKSRADTGSAPTQKKIPFVYGTCKKEENKSLDQKMFDINGFEGFSLKTCDIITP